MTREEEYKMKRKCSNCTNSFYIRREGSPILHKIDCLKLSMMTNKENELYFKGDKENCPYWNKSEFDKEEELKRICGSRLRT
jgi:hypothetical protein